MSKSDKHLETLAQHLSDQLIARVNEITRERLGLKGTKIADVARPKPRTRKAARPHEYEPPANEPPTLQPIDVKAAVVIFGDMSNTDRVRKVFEMAGKQGLRNDDVVRQTGLTTDQVQKLVHNLFHKGELNKFETAHYVSPKFFEDG